MSVAAARRSIILLLLALLCSLLAPFAVPAQPAQAAAPAFVQNLGTIDGGQPLAIVTTAKVTAGNSIVVAIWTLNFSGTTLPGSPTCADGVNGNYDVDVSVPHAAGAPKRLTICSKHNVIELPAGSVITATWSDSDSPVSHGLATEYSGLTANPRDQTTSAVGFGKTPDSGPTSTTTQVRELLVGAIGLSAGSKAPVFGTNGTATPCLSGGTPTFTKRIERFVAFTSGVALGDCEVTATGAYRVTGTIDNSRWQAPLVTYIAADQPPTLTTTSSALTYSENAGAVPIDPGLVLVDPNSPTLAGASVSIIGNYQSGEDSLQFTDQNGIHGVIAGNTLTLTGTATKANYAAALQSVTYTNSSEHPNTVTRTVTFSVSDGLPPSGTASRDITVAAVNDPPVNTVPAAQTTPANTSRVFSTANGNAIAIADLDAGTGPVQVTLAVSAGTGTLTLGSTTSLNVVGNGTATITATGTLADLNAGLQGLSFTPTNVTGTTTLTVTTNDQGNTGGPAQQDQDTVSIAVGALPTISVGDPPPVTEGDSGSANSITFTVTLSAASNLAVSVPYTLDNDTATGGTSCATGVDFLNTGGTVTFQPNDTSETVTVTVCADTLVEGNETLLVNLGTPTGGATVADGQATGTITDDDLAGGFSFNAATASVPENAGSVTLTVQRGGAGPAATSTQAGTVPSGSVRPAATSPGTVSPSALGAATVNYATANGSALAGQDYTATSGTLTFGVNESARSIVIPLIIDSAPEPNETFTVTLSAPTGGASIAQATITVTIVDTSHGEYVVPPEDDTDKPKKETEDERRQRARTNRGNRDDEATEGDVIETRCDQPWPSIVIANRDGLVEVRLVKEAQKACSSAQVGDYLEADGQKQHEFLFDADSIDVKHR